MVAGAAKTVKSPEHPSRVLCIPRLNAAVAARAQALSELV